MIAGAIQKAHEVIQEVVSMIEELQAQVPVEKEATLVELDANLYEKVKAEIHDRLVVLKTITGKQERNNAVNELFDEVRTRYAEAAEGDPQAAVDANMLNRVLDKIEEEVVRKMILEGKRPDGRGEADVRPISCEVGVLPRTHGSALFTRGETQALVSVTLGTIRDAQIIDGLQEEYAQSFTYHYNFPPFAVGEVKPIRGPGRREIGHGALAERALENVRPPEEDFAYTIRIVSDITESNGSSSMASVCGGSLALMDAGVPINGAVAGISVGWVSDHTGRYKLLTDIIGEEDHFGDMDFKIAGTTSRHHRDPTRHQGDGAAAPDHGGGPGAGTNGPAEDPGSDEPGHQRAAGGAEQVRPEADHHGDRPRVHREDHRPGGQDDQEPPGADGYHHRDRRGRHHLHQLHGRRRPSQGQRDDRGDDPAAGSWPDLQRGQGRLCQGIRRASSRSCLAWKDCATSAS